MSLSSREHNFAMDACGNDAACISMDASLSENTEALAAYLLSVRNLIQHQETCRSRYLSEIASATAEFQNGQMGNAYMDAQSALEAAQLLMSSYKVVNRTALKVQGRLRYTNGMNEQCEHLKQMFQESAAKCREALGFVTKSAQMMAQSSESLDDESVALLTIGPDFTPLGAEYFAPVLGAEASSQENELQAAREASLAEASNRALALARMEPDPEKEEEDDNPSSDSEGASSDGSSSETEGEDNPSSDNEV